MQFISRGFYLFSICSIYHVNNCIDSSAVPLPHAPEPGLSAYVPDLYCDVAFSYFPHVEAHCGYHIFTELTGRDDIDEGGLAGVLQPHERQFHLLLPEERTEPVQQAGDERQHGGGRLRAWTGADDSGHSFPRAGIGPEPANGSSAGPLARRGQTEAGGSDGRSQVKSPAAGRWAAWPVCP